MSVIAIPLFSDNYAYLVHDAASGTAVAVDPADPDVIWAALGEIKATLTAVLCTHHHWDHAGGNAALAARVPGLQVFGGEPMSALTTLVGGGGEDGAGGDGGDGFAVGRLRIQAIRGAGHTRGHVCFLVGVADEPAARVALFSGDTLFVGGCGKFFEGSASDMMRTFGALVRRVPATALLFAGHEYTVANLQFGVSVAPHLRAVKEALQRARALRSLQRPTVPSTLAAELRHNVFLCAVSDPHVQRTLGTRDAVETLARLRELKSSGAAPLAAASAADRPRLASAKKRR